MRHRFRTPGTKTTRRQRFGDRRAPVRTGTAGTPKEQKKISDALLRSIDGHARFESGPPECWERMHDAAMEATDNKAVRCMPRGYLYWERSAQSSLGRALEV